MTAKRPREALLAEADKARLSKSLVTLHRDVPVSLDLSRFAAAEPDWPALLPILRELEFNSLVRTLADRAVAGPAPAPQEPSHEMPAAPAPATVPAVPSDVRYGIADTPQSRLSADRLLMPVNEPGHAHQHQGKEDYRCADQHVAVQRLPQRVAGDEHSRRRERGAREHEQAIPR